MIDSAVIFIVTLAFVIRTTRNTLYHTFLWQLKEYRFDRYRAHLALPQGKKMLFGPVSSVKLVLLLFIVFFLNVWSEKSQSGSVFVMTGGAIFFYWVFWLVWIVEAARNLYELKSRGWKHPVWTVRSSVIVFIVFVPAAILFLENPLVLIVGPFLDKLLPFFVASAVEVSSGGVFLAKRAIILLATTKMRSFSETVVVGVTGSYGKTSTKEAIGAILSSLTRTKTPGSVNTELGVATYILKHVSTRPKVFIVEMGAYGRGEIAAICRMVHPSIAVITGLSNQHQELFGSFDAIMQTKYELVQSLPKSGIAIFNGNNPFCVELARKAESQHITTMIYSTSSVISNLQVFKDHLRFTIFPGKDQIHAHASLIGKQSVEHILAGVYIAKLLNIGKNEIEEGIRHIKGASHTMDRSITSSGMSIIDDSFNASETSIRSALEYMSIFKKDKILVFSPIIELGKEGAEVHERIGRLAASVCDKIYVTNTTYMNDLKKGIEKNTPQDESKHSQKIAEVMIGKIDTIGAFIRSSGNPESVMVFEGREAGKILEKIIKENPGVLKK